MKIRDIFSAAAIAIRHLTVASNKQQYLGKGLFPAKKKMGLDLKWLKTHKGLPISLAPSDFDAKSTLRSRSGFKMDETEMAFFRESYVIKEADEQEIMRVEDSADPYAKEVIDRIYDDADNLIAGAEVVPERMTMQLLSAEDGSPKIKIQANGVNYAYNYDPTGSYKANNFMELSGTSMWSDIENSDPLEDVSVGIDAVEDETGETPSIMIVSKKTMNYLKKNAKIKNAIVSKSDSPVVFINEKKVKALFSEELGVSIIKYTKKYKDETGTARAFYPDGFATLIPSGALGNTWYGCTPEERTGMASADADVQLVGDTGITVMVTSTHDPEQTKITVSEIVLPSFERMDETFQIKCYSTVEGTSDDTKNDDSSDAEQYSNG